MFSLRDRLRDGGLPVVREVADPSRAARDREPRLGTNRQRGRVEVGPAVAELHPPHLDPLVGRTRAGERSELALRLVDGGEPVAPAPDLERVEIEADHVGASDELRIDATARRDACRAAVDVPAEREERDALRLLPRRMEGQRLRGPVQVGFVRVVPADRAATVRDVLVDRGNRGHRARPKRVELHPRRAAAAPHVEVDAGVQALRVRPVALAVHHAREERLPVDVQGAVDHRTDRPLRERARRERAGCPHDRPSTACGHAVAVRGQRLERAEQRTTGRACTRRRAQPDAVVGGAADLDRHARRTARRPRERRGVCARLDGGADRERSLCGGCQHERCKRDAEPAQHPAEGSLVPCGPC